MPDDEEFYFGNWADGRPRLYRRNAMLPQLPNLPLATNIEAGWECRICLEGKDDRIIVLHPCGNNHSYHHECIGQWIRINRQCPYCRGVAPEPIPIHVGLRRVNVSENNCAHCGRVIYGQNIEIVNCGHHLHSHCALNIIIEQGISHTGLLRCHRCEQQ